MDKDSYSEKILSRASELASTAGKVLDKTIDKTKKAGITAVHFGVGAAGTMQDAGSRSGRLILEKLDRNGDGQVDVVDIIILSLKVPGVRISRAQFLQKVLSKTHSEEEISAAIAGTPAKAGIPREEIDRIADEVINFERNCVTGVSAALGMPGGAAMAATIPADIVQYYGYTLRAVQKMLYLYGFPEIDFSGVDLNPDEETLNVLTLCLGVMYGAAGANNAVKGMAKVLSAGAEKQLVKMALTKGAFYPIAESTARWFGVKMTRQILAGFFQKAVPVVGGLVGGGVTFLSFRPCCSRLKAVLMDTLLADPEHVSDPEEIALAESILTGIDAEE